MVKQCGMVVLMRYILGFTTAAYLRLAAVFEATNMIRIISSICRVRSYF